MTVGQLLDDVREQYLTEFRECIADVKERGMKPESEAALRDEHEAMGKERALSVPMRLDVMGFADGESKDTIRVDSDSMLSFEQIDFEWAGGLPTRLAPFAWDACDIKVFDIPTNSKWSYVRGWFDRWFDGEDTRQADED